MYEFKIDPGRERENLYPFLDIHNKRHGREKTAIGGRFTYSFCPTSLGDIITVKCFCGEEIDITDYGSW